LVAFARNHPRCATLDIIACKGLNRGADIDVAMVAAMPDL
jgi:hypothetical protein